MKPNFSSVGVDTSSLGRVKNGFLSTVGMKSTSKKGRIYNVKAPTALRAMKNPIQCMRWEKIHVRVVGITVFIGELLV